LFHIFWAGPFTDKPYSAALSFLYTQHLALDRPIGVEYGEFPAEGIGVLEDGATHVPVAPWPGKIPTPVEPMAKQGEHE
jgi:hypothetical protein